MCKERQDDDWKNWSRLLEAAQSVQKPRRISEYVDAGAVGAAILSESGRIFTGICVDTACSLGICAERNAIFAMLTHGEEKFSKLVAFMGDGNPGPPCGACRELILQLMPSSGRDVEVLLDQHPLRIVRLGELTPDWWIPERT